MTEPAPLSGSATLFMAAVAILALAALVVAFWVAYSVAKVRDQMDDFIDRNTPSFAEEHTDEIPRVPIPTEPNGMPLAVEGAKLEAERTGGKHRARSST